METDGQVQSGIDLLEEAKIRSGIDGTLFDGALEINKLESG